MQRNANGAIKPYLLPKVGTHDRQIVFRETSYYFILKVIPGGCNSAAVTLLVRAAALINHFFQTIVKVLVLAAFGDLCLIIKLDFIDQKAGKSLSLAMNVLILRRKR